METQAKKRNKVWIRLAFVLAILGSYFLIPQVKLQVNQVVMLFSMANIETIKQYILSFGIWAPVISFFLMIFQSLMAPLPAFLITFANAGLFGWLWGALLSWASAMAGASLCFLLARFLGREFVEKLNSKGTLNQIEEFFDKHGKYAILIARLLPFMSFDIVSYAAGLTSMSFWSFFWATGLGQLPATLIYSYVGGMLTGGVKYFVMGLFCLFAISALIFLMKKMANEKKNSEVDMVSQKSHIPENENVV
ncbi:MAG: TVP38/TMEM64 family protein [Tissierellales bacterium]|jgi:uncharacterized membrane protein YdjX (TVP38/TMEM64 family)|nr:TVP38/TMEM64 family protein [Tissierellales bacterium]